MYLDDTLRARLGTESSDPGSASSVRGRFKAAPASEHAGITRASDPCRASSAHGHSGSSVRMAGQGGARPPDPGCISMRRGGSEPPVGSESIGGVGSADSDRASSTRGNPGLVPGLEGPSVMGRTTPMVSADVPPPPVRHGRHRHGWAARLR